MLPNVMWILHARPQAFIGWLHCPSDGSLGGIVHICVHPSTHGFYIMLCFGVCFAMTIMRPFQRERDTSFLPSITLERPSSVAASCTNSSRYLIYASLQRRRRCKETTAIMFGRFIHSSSSSVASFSDLIRIRAARPLVSPTLCFERLSLHLLCRIILRMSRGAG